MELHPQGLATGIGSLPHTDPEAAVALVRKFLPVIPHWPQLPASTHKEFYLTQFLNLLQEVGLLRVTGRTSAVFATDDPAWTDNQASFYDLYLKALDGDHESLERLAFPPGSAAGFEQFCRELALVGTGSARYLKGQVVGLLTVGFQITDPERRPAYYDQQLRDLLLKQLSLQAAYQVKTLGRHGLPVIIFMDDPMIDSCGRYDRICVSKEEIKAELGEFASVVRNLGGFAGVHSCADLDWSILLEAEIDVISFDTYQFGPTFALYVEALNSFLKRGGVVAWGLVPTNAEILAGVDYESIYQQSRELFQMLISKGVDPLLLKEQALVTPACGAGTLSEEAALKIYELTAALSDDWEKMFS